MNSNLSLRYYSPAATDNAGGQSGEAPQNSRTRNLPRADADWATLAVDVSRAWQSNPQLTLIWTTSTEFAERAQRYKDDLQERVDTGGRRPGVTAAMASLEDQIAAGLSETKVYIMHKFKKKGAAAQYPRYGLVHRNRHWELPIDHDDLRVSLKSLVAAIREDGFDAEEYGAAFWANIQEQFEKNFSKSRTIDGQVSEKKEDKDTGKAYLNKVLVALHKLLEANYPDTFEAVRRQWGWQKEDY